MSKRIEKMGYISDIITYIVLTSFAIAIAIYARLKAEDHMRSPFEQFFMTFGCACFVGVMCWCAYGAIKHRVRAYKNIS